VSKPDSQRDIEHLHEDLTVLPEHTTFLLLGLTALLGFLRDRRA
jgi:hypothetical protein